jgi:hypothetical protein
VVCDPRSVVDEHVDGDDVDTALSQARHAVEDGVGCGRGGLEGDERAADAGPRAIARPTSGLWRNDDHRRARRGGDGTSEMPDPPAGARQRASAHDDDGHVGCGDLPSKGALDGVVTGHDGDDPERDAVAGGERLRHLDA